MASDTKEDEAGAVQHVSTNLERQAAVVFDAHVGANRGRSNLVLISASEEKEF